MAKEEEIYLNQARSARVQAQLTLETVHVRRSGSTREGLVAQQTKEFEGRIALGRSDTQRMADHLSWSERMLSKGYLSRAELATERQALDRALHELRTAEGEFRLFQRFQSEKEIASLRGQVTIAERNLKLETSRLKAQEEQYAHVRKQIERLQRARPAGRRRDHRPQAVPVAQVPGAWRARLREPGAVQATRPLADGGRGFPARVDGASGEGRHAGRGPRRVAGRGAPGGWPRSRHSRRSTGRNGTSG